VRTEQDPQIARDDLNMLDREPLWYPSRGPFNPGVPNRQLWAIGMVVVQWGILELIREQSIYGLMEDNATLIEDYKRRRNSEQKNTFWKTLVEAKMEEPERSKNRAFITRFEALNNQRDEIIHRMWGGGIEAGTPGTPDGVQTTDAAMHRSRDENIKTKATDARRNLRWRLSFSGLRQIAHNMAQLSQDIFMSWLPPGTPPGTLLHIWSYVNPEGRLVIGVAPAAESEPHAVNPT
jgi:hypothetical protein